MSSSDDLDERLLRWRELREQGKEVAAEELCADRPELSVPLERLIRKWKLIETVLPLDIGDKSASSSLAKANSSTDQLYTIVEKLGEGGMGIVYKARERETGRLVALKKMKRFDPVALDRMKKGVRALQDVCHPNLVTLFDVHSDGAEWFFTMELVDGHPFPGHLAWSGGDAPDSITIDQPSSAPGAFDPGSPTGDQPPPRASAGNLDRLRAAFLQLADAIQTLHEHNVLHRDIKPSNVLIAPLGRVVVLDFDLVTEAVVNENSFTHEGLAGTLQYMAPVHGHGRAEKASDWYSFGVMLYETLTGRHPFRGTAQEMPWARQNFEPPSPRSLVADIPDDLSRLCDDLLRFVPSERPPGPEVRRRIAGDLSGRTDAPAALPPFIGRARHLSALADAFADSSQRGRTVVVLLHGQSGMGKSALAQHFLDHLRGQSGNPILRGRCYQRESVPYKALDGLVDSLSRFWRRLRREQAAELLPQDVGPLVRVFPALLRVEAVAGAPRRDKESPDPHEQRRRAFAALREVLHRIGDRWPLVVYLDDLQWGDVDSALMLTDMLMPPDQPRLLLVACFRNEDRLTSPFLCHFLPPATQTVIDRREMSVESLSYAEACNLAGHLLKEAGAPSIDAAAAIARESAGNPFFIYALVRADQAGEPVVLDQVIWRWICSLDEAQRHLLEIVAVAGRPLRSNTAIRAAELEDHGRKALIALQAARLLLLGGGPTEQVEVETYHDRIRETVVAHLTPEVLRERHRRLAVALVSSGRAEPDVLAEHFHRSGDLEQAGAYYEKAGDQAAQILAFDRAAKLYRLVLEVREVGPEETSRLQTLLGKALANAGRGAEAAQAYLAAVSGASRAQALDLQRLAGDQFMRAGHIEEGLDVLRIVLRRIGVSLPETRRQILLSVWWGRIRVWWRGTRFRERAESQIPSEELARIDMCWSIGSTLALADAIRGQAFHLRHFYPLALAAGEPSRVALALGAVACTHAIGGVSGRTRAEALLQQARELAERTGRPFARAMVEGMAGICAFFLGHWKRASELSELAEQLLRKETGVAWELGINYHIRFYALLLCGEWKRCAQELPALLREAHERGDLATACRLQIHSAYLAIAADQPDKARQALAEGVRQFGLKGGFYLVHQQALLGEAETALYAGEFDQAWAVINQRWPALQESLLLRFQDIRILTHQHHIRARCALAAAFGSGIAARSAPRADLVQSAQRDARLLERERMPYAVPSARLIRATIAFRQGSRRETVTLLEAAAAGYQDADMLLHAAAVRWQLGLLLGDERGRALIQKAKAFMTSQEIRNPGRVLHIYTPGFPATE